jgi:hypothetical protein
MPKKSVQSNPWGKIAPFALTSLASFLLGALLLFFMVWKADKLVALGLTGRVYYIVLLPLGLSVAGFLFGVLQSYATYQGRQLGGKLVLGGPIIAFLLVVILGFFLVPDLSTFPLTVYVHGPGGPHDVVLRNSGEVFMDLGGDRRHVQIGDQGQAYFPAIPASFRGQEVRIWVDSEKFESIDPGKKLKPDGPNVYIPVRRKAGRISGRVRDENGDGISGAQVHVAGLSAAVDAASGHFELSIPGDRLQNGLELVAGAPGYASKSYQIVPSSNEISITLSKSR